jgi:serine/threonine-protein kinase
VQPPVEVGAVLASKYRIERVLGSGAMGVVVAALQRDLGFPVAIKFMAASSVSNQSATARFMREARAAARLRSEHVARVIDFGKLESGAPYIVMEYLEGSDLDALRKSQGKLLAHEAVGYIIQACKGLSEAHAQGIVHRDLKPHNLFLTRRPDGSPLVKIVDFGVSKLLDLVEDTVTGDGSGDPMVATRTASMMGTPAYMSPEQLRSAKNVDLRSDVFSLGATLYQLVSGALPFRADTLGEMVFVVATEPPKPLANAAPDLSPDLIGIIDRCLAKDPDARFQSVDELARALEPFVDPLRVTRSAGDFRITSSASQALEAGTLAEAAVSRVAPRPNATGLMVGLGVAGGATLVVVVLLVLGVFRFGGPETEAETEAQEEASAGPSSFAAPSPVPASEVPSVTTVASAEPPDVPSVEPSASASAVASVPAPPPLRPLPKAVPKTPPPPQPPPPPGDPFATPD